MSGAQLGGHPATPRCPPTQRCAPGAGLSVVGQECAEGTHTIDLQVARLRLASFFVFVCLLVHHPPICLHRVSCLCLHEMESLHHCIGMRCWHLWCCAPREQNKTVSWVGVCVGVSITAHCLHLLCPGTLFCPLQMQARALLAGIHSQPDSIRVQTRTACKAQS